MNEKFARDVMHGLSDKPKYLSSKYFYDQKGDKLFQQIMELDEYYLTRCEYEIFQSYKSEILNEITTDSSSFDLIEFGAGDGKKTKILMEYFLNQASDFHYMPIDISQNALSLLADDLKERLPELRLETLQGEYFEVLSKLEVAPDRTKVILFLGSNIGNFLRPVAQEFLAQLAKVLNQGDMLLLGVDLVKDPSLIARAYNDSMGITAAFNKNILTRINRELGGNFDLDAFLHYPLYNPLTGTARSFLISKVAQTVSIGKLNAQFHFGAWEPVHTEYSHKYRLDELTELADGSGFETVSNYFDSKGYFTDTLLKVR